MVLDFHKKEHIPMISLYKKSSGIALVQKYLPHINPCEHLFIIDSIDDWNKIKKYFTRELLTMRSDSKKAEELAKCPHALSSTVNDVPNYIEKVKNAVNRCCNCMYGYEKWSK